MIAVDQQPPGRQRMLRAVREREGRPPVAQRAQRGIVRDAAKGQDRRPLRSRAQIGGQEAVARAHFLRRRLVGGRQAFDGVGDPAAGQPQPIAARFGDRPGCKAVRMQRRVEQDAGVVAGERTAARIGAMHARSQADDHESRGRLAERGHRPAPVGGMRGANVREERGQARTATAGLVVDGGHQESEFR